jgi:hypothetical protein
MILVLFLVVTLCWCPLISAAEVDVRGEFGVIGSWFPEEGVVDEVDGGIIFFVQPEVYLENSEANTAFLFKPKASWNAIDNSQKRFNSGDTYLEYRARNWELRAGSMLLFAGSVESEHLVDVFNQKDYEMDFPDAEKLGEWGVRFRGIRDNLSFDLLAFPTFTEAPLPGSRNRFNFFPGVEGLGENNLYSSSREDDRPQGGARLALILDNADIGFTYFNGYNKFPAIYLDALSAVPHTYYYEQHLVGLDLQWALGNWLVKAESVYRDTGIAGQQVEVLASTPEGVRILPLVPESDNAFVGGIEYTFPSFWRSQDLTVGAEYLYDSNKNPNAPIFLPFGNDIFVAGHWVLNDLRSTSLKFGVFFDLDNASRWTQIEAETLMFERFHVAMRYDDIHAEDDIFLGYFDEDSRLSLTVTYLF